MATLALALAGSAIGASVSSGVVAFGLTAAQIGFMAGSLIGQYYFNKPDDQVGPKSNNTRVDAGQYGQPIHRCWGRQLITAEWLWIVDPLIEVENVEDAGGKGGGSTITRYSYKMHGIARVCGNKVAAFRRVWLNDVLIYDSNEPELIDDRYLQRDDMKFYLGTDDQMPDPTYEAHFGVGNVPAFRGQAYISFTDLSLERTGGVPPIVKVEVYESATFTGGSFVATEIFRTPAKVFGQPGAFWNGVVYNHALDVVYILQGEWDGTAYTNHIRIHQTSGAFGGYVANIPTGGANALNDFIYLPQPFTVYDQIRKQFYFTDDSQYKIAVIDATTNSYVKTLPNDTYSPDVNPYTGFVYAATNDFAQQMTVLNPATGLRITWDWSTYVGGIYPNNGLKASTLWFHSATYAYMFSYPKIWLIDLDAGVPIVVGNYPANFYASSLGIKGDNFWFMEPGVFHILNLQTLVLASYPLTDSGDGEWRWWPDLFKGRVWYWKNDKAANVSRLVCFDADTRAELFTFEVSDGPNSPAKFDEVMTLDPTGPETYFTMYREDSTGTGFDVLYKVGSGGQLTATPATVSLDKIITDVSIDSGLTAVEVDVSECATTSVTGYTASGILTGRAKLETLLSAYGFDAVRSGYKVAFRARAKLPVADLKASDFLLQEGGEQSFERESFIELPRAVIVKYQSAESQEYGTETATATLQAAKSLSSMVLDFAVVMTAKEAHELAWKLLTSLWSESNVFRRDVSLRFAALEPGDVVTLPFAASTVEARIVRISDKGLRRSLELTSYQSSAYSQLGVGQSRVDPATQVVDYVTIASLFVLDVPSLRSADQGLFVYVTALPEDGKRWMGGVVQKSSDASSWVTVGQIGVGATWGTCDGLQTWYGAANAIDRFNTSVFTVRAGSIDGVTENQMRDGANIAALTDSVGGFELVQFSKTELVGANQYRVSNLLRDRLSRDDRLGINGAAQFAMLGAKGTIAVPMDRSEVDKGVYFRIVSGGQAVEAAAAQFVNFRGRSMRPRAPTYLRVTRDTLGNITIKFNRRALRNYKWLDGSDIPLDQSIERYLVSIYQSQNATGIAPVRAVEISATEFVYTATMQNADFGELQPQVQIGIKMYSSYFEGFNHSDEALIYK
jgi:hypothetical protein